MRPIRHSAVSFFVATSPTAVRQLDGGQRPRAVSVLVNARHGHPSSSSDLGGARATPSCGDGSGARSTGTAPFVDFRVPAARGSFRPTCRRSASSPPQHGGVHPGSTTTRDDRTARSIAVPSTTRFPSGSMQLRRHLPGARRRLSLRCDQDGGPLVADCDPWQRAFTKHVARSDCSALSNAATDVDPV